MRTITLDNLSLQFDADQITSGPIEDQIRDAVDLINSVLQRDPYGLAAQINRGESERRFVEETGDVEHL